MGGLPVPGYRDAEGVWVIFVSALVSYGRRIGSSAVGIWIIDALRYVWGGELGDMNWRSSGNYGMMNMTVGL